MIKISAAIICYNEEAKISKCLDSLVGLADEIIVVDSFSTDKTKEICMAYDLKFLEHEFVGHIEQKNYALSLCEGDYILSLDADEALSPQLKNNLLKMKANLNASAYHFNRLTSYGDFWVRHCGWYPDRKLRLIRKNAGSWQGLNPHDILELDDHSSPILVEGDLLHYSYDSITDHIDQTNRFTTIAAKAAYACGTRSSLFKIVSRPILKFFKDYALKRGFLDGRYGLIICTINSLSAFLKYSKIKELQEGRDI